MKVIVFLAILGLTLGGFRHDMKRFGGDLKKAGHWVSKHHKAIETGLGDALKVGELVAESSEFVNVNGLVKDGVKTVSDATQKKKNVGTLVQDGLKILGDLTSGNSNSNSNSSPVSNTNTEELFSFGGLLHDAGDVAGIVGAGAAVAGLFADDELVNVGGLIENGLKTYQDATQKNKNIGTLIQDGINIIGDLTSGNSNSNSNSNTEELFSFGGLLHDAGDVAGIIGAGASVAGLFADDELVNLGGLIENGLKTYQDATQKNKNIGSLVQDGINIIGDLASGNSNSNTEELFSFGGLLHDAGDIAGIVGAGASVAGLFADDELVNVGGLIENGLKTYQDATQKNKNIGSLVQDGINIIGDLTSGNSNSEEFFSFGGLLHDAGDVAGIVGAGAAVAGLFADDELVNVGGLIENGLKTYQDATQKNKNIGSLVQDGINIIGDLTSGNSNTEEFFSFGGLLHDAGDVAGIVGAGAAVAGLFADDELVNVGGLIENGLKTYQDATQKNKNIGSLVQDGINIIGDLTSGNSNSNTEELFSFGGLLHDAGDVAGIVGAGAAVAGLFADDELVNVGGLIENGLKTYQDATQKNKNIGSLVQDGINIIGDLTSGNSNSNTEELFSFGGLLHDAGDIAGIVGAGASVAGLFADDQLLSFQNVLDDAGTVAGIIGAGAAVVGLFVEDQ